MNAKLKEVQKQVTGMIDLNPKLLESDGALHIYRVEDEIRLEDFTKPVTHSVDFSTVDATAKCSCGLFEMRGILCRHIYAIFRSNEINFLPDKYILDRWRKDIKRRYTLIHSSYDAREQRADSNRYSKLLNICYQMITRAAGTKVHTEDAKSKLYAMIELYDANQEPPSMTKTGSNACSTAKDTNTGSGSGQVCSPHIVRRKGRPLSLRRASRMEIDIRKTKAKTKKTPSKGKRKERDGGDTQAMDTCRNLFGNTQMDMPNVEITRSQLRETVIQSQESIQSGLDRSQPLKYGMDGNDMDGSQGRE
ncbi:uncharacterized protein LOC122299037 [Carya illinoinensis]|uniref:uncharacterized protein LOC122299037 n=1 Tax=Carya illinoinensis TaxID=32201 RepID=UPI001C722BCC|nr:uncharacterized protein LOC122299037 [Carya illinoinensis]